MELLSLLDNEITEQNINKLFKEINNAEFLLPFYNDHLLELYTEDNKNYIPLYTDESQIKNKEYTRLDKVRIDVVLRDIFNNEKYHAISINPDTHDFIINRKMADIYKCLINKGEDIMNFKVGLNIIGGPAASGKTSTIVNLVNLDSETKNVLFLSLEIGLNTLIERYSLNGRDSITVIDKVTSIEELDNEISNNKYDVVYIDYIMLLKTNPDKYETKINELVELAKKHNITIVATDYMSLSDIPNKYKNELYKDVATIQVLEMLINE